MANYGIGKRIFCNTSVSFNPLFYFATEDSLSIPLSILTEGMAFLNYIL